MLKIHELHTNTYQVCNLHIVMKFEIDEVTGMVKDEITLDFIPTETTSGDNPISHHPITSHQLEQILQAVKKTQKALENKETEDSKNTVHLKVNDSYTSQDVKQIQDYLSKIPTGTEISVVLNKNIQRINQNQKIVDELIYHYKHTHSSDHDLKSFAENTIRSVTGKTIEELSE